MKTKSQYTLFGLAFPMVVEFFFQRMFTVADTLVLSSYSDNAVASVGYADQILNILFLIYQVIASGTSILLAQAVGAKDTKKQSDICTASLWLGLIMGLLSSLIIFLSRNVLLSLLNVDLSLFSHASDYLSTMALGQIFTCLFFILTAIFRSQGQAYLTSTIAIISNLANVFGDFLVIKGTIHIFGTVRDVALVTVFAKALACICALILLLYHSRNTLQCSFPMKTMKEVLHLGIPAAGESCSYKLSQLAGTAIIGSLGTQVLAGKIYGMNFSSIMVLIPNAIAIATGIIVGVHAGENDFVTARKTALSNIQKGALAIIIIDIPFILFGQSIIARFFTQDPLTQKVAYFVLCAEAITMFIKNINLSLGNSLRAIKDVNYPVIISIISMWAFGTGLCWILGIPLNLGIVGVFIAFFVDEALRAYLLYRRWIKKTE